MSFLALDAEATCSGSGNKPYRQYRRETPGSIAMRRYWPEVLEQFGYRSGFQGSVWRKNAEKYGKWPVTLARAHP